MNTKDKIKTNDELFKEYAKSHSIEIRNEIALNSMGLVPYTIKKYGLYVKGIHNYVEMLQDGYLALIKAVEKFNPSLNFKFSTYAVKCILSLTNNRLDYHKDLSLDSPLKSSAYEDLFLIDTIKDDNVHIEKDVINQQLYADIRNNLSSHLDSLELMVITAFYGIGQEEKTYRQISSKLNLNIKTIQEIKHKAENKIRSTEYFKILYLETNPISYYPTFDFTDEKTGPTNRILSPVESIALKKIKRERNLLGKNELHHNI